MFDAAAGREDLRDDDLQPPVGSHQQALYLRIYSDEFKFVWNSLRKVGVPESDLADLTHDVFMTVHARLSTYDRSRPVRPWLSGIVYRVAMDHRRLSRHSREVLPGEGHSLERVDPRPRPDEALFDRQAREVAAKVLATMDPRLRTVLVMCDLGERPANEIASSLGIPVKTVYTRLRLARARFAAAAERLGEAVSASGK
jgi:RNA polymerase sigma-70 factor (ECF subfamily)